MRILSPKNNPFRLVENPNFQDWFFRSFKYLHFLIYQNRFNTPTVKMCYTHQFHQDSYQFKIKDLEFILQEQVVRV